MLEVLRHRLQGLEQVLQHRQVRLHLLTIAPAFHQAGLFVDGGIDDMGHVGHLPEDFLAAPLVEQINRQEFRALDRSRHAS
jgi:hypothetical protein